MKQRDHQLESSSYTANTTPNCLIEVRQYSPWNKFTVFCPDFFVLHGTASFSPPFSPNQQNKKINGVKVWNRGTAK